MRAPLDTYQVTPRGPYGFDRGDVTHRGVDLGAPHKTPVYAPENMEVMYVATDDKTKPLTGYGPGAILAKGESGVYHVLGHLDAWGWSITSPYGYPDGRDLKPYVGRRYKEGELIGYVSRLNHVHWEIRDVPLPARGDDRAEHTIDPIAWLDGATTPVKPAESTTGGGSALLLIVLLVAFMGDRNG